ncbi:TRAP transporter substrate-binding protein [Testudinibacter sp. P80/BLE/0925]|uniref:TRAP transporter substrate-binding protein n=1 Tax=Testudinibacter sp. TW-1 TaxID=3417757 RepID=UPI003D35F111
MKKMTMTLMSLMFLAFSDVTHALTLKIADNHSKDDSTVRALEDFSKKISERTQGKVKARVYANGVLGDEVQVLQQLQQGIIDIGRVSTSNLSQFKPQFSIISMPYLFNDMEHFKRFANSSVGKEFLDSIDDDGMIGITFYTNGFRSFYTKSKPIHTPADLDGLKIRVMGDTTAINMVNHLGAKATPMAYSEVFSAIQQGVLDGAESAITVLTNGSHGEVAKYFSFDEHSLIPDVVVISKKSYEKLNEDERNQVIQALKESWVLQDKLFVEDMEVAYKIAQEKMKVNFNDVNKEPFRELVKPMYDSLPQNDKDIVEKIKDL